MGGIGSGNWDRSDKKLTVEESLTLAMAGFRDRIRDGLSGTVTWAWADGSASSIGYLVNLASVRTLTLHYCWMESEDVEITIYLQTTPLHFGGQRWWFTCPLVANGVACNRRAGKLHLPPGARYFGCRICHGLTYRSCQEAHQMERLFCRIARMESSLLESKKRGA